MNMESDYTIDDAIGVISKAIERKRGEIAALEQKKRRLKKEETVAEVQGLIDYLEADVTAYLTVLADMTEDDSIIEGLDLDDDTVTECPAKYDRYIAGLSADDLENELEADEIRAEYCDQIVDMMCYDIGMAALDSKKMIKFMKEDPYALTAIGEVIFYDDYLYDSFKAMCEGSEPKKKKKKKKKD